MNKLSSYLNLNIVLGLFVSLSFFLVLLVSGTVILPYKAEAVNCVITRNLNYGDRGADVACLQSSLGIQPDGFYGPMTQASIMAYQVNHGLPVDGVFGFSTLAVWSSEQLGQFNPSPIPVPNPNFQYPMGCISYSGFSSITGQPCNTTVINNPSSVCLPGQAYSVLTGQPCFGSDMVINLPIGCSSLSGYSYVTGYRCDNQILPNPYVPDNLQGGAGDIEVTSTSVDVENEIGEGDDNQKILGIRIEADGSDVRINSVRVSFENNDHISSSNLDRYIEDVSIYMDNKKVGSADVDEFSESGDVYSENIQLSNAVVREGTKNRENFYVAVTVNRNITDQNLENEDWDVYIERDGIRFTDGNGSNITARTKEITSNPDFVIESSSNGDVRVRIAKTSGSPDEGNVEVSSEGTTNNVEMLEFTVRADGTDITFDRMDFDVEADGSADVEDIISELAIYQGSEMLGDVTNFNGDDTYTIDFYDDMTIDEDDTETFTVKARVKKIGTSSFAQGDSLRVSTGDPLFESGVEDDDGDEIDNVTGSADGEFQSFYSEGIEVSDLQSRSSATTSSNGHIRSQTYTISFDITALGGDYYIPKNTARDAGPNAGLIYSVETSGGYTSLSTSNVISSSSSSISSSAKTVGGYYEIPDGETETFNVTITLSNSWAGMVPGFYRVQLTEVHYDDNQTGMLNTYNLTPAQDFETNDRQLDSI